MARRSGRRWIGLDGDNEKVAQVEPVTADGDQRWHAHVLDGSLFGVDVGTYDTAEAAKAAVDTRMCAVAGGLEWWRRGVLPLYDFPMSDLDPHLQPALPVTVLLNACDVDDAARALSALHPSLIADIKASYAEWSVWWSETRDAHAGYSDREAWAMTRTMGPAVHSKWGPGVRVSLTRRDGVIAQPGGVTEGGEPYEELAQPTVAPRTFWVMETDEGWKIRGFDVTG